MTTQFSTPEYQLKSHLAKHKKLEKLLEKVDYAILGEEPEMRYELERIRKNTIVMMKEEQDIIIELNLLLKEKVNA